jgi:UDP-N-acetylglucosamine:LPS N-acetylglucosamine transferase
VLLEDKFLKASLLTMITDLMKDQERLAQMSAAMRALSNPDAALAISELLMEMAGA